MKLITALIFLLALAAGASGQKADDLATTVIKSQSPGAYNPLNKSEEELNKAAAFNSRLRLQYLMLHEVTNQELKICYALQVVESQIAALQPSASERNKRVNDRLALLLKQQSSLAKELRALQNKGSEPGGPANRRQPIRSETNRTSSAAGSRR